MLPCISDVRTGRAVPWERRFFPLQREEDEKSSQSGHSPPNRIDRSRFSIVVCTLEADLDFRAVFASHAEARRPCASRRVGALAM